MDPHAKKNGHEKRPSALHNIERVSQIAKQEYPQPKAQKPNEVFLFSSANITKINKMTTPEPKSQPVNKYYEILDKILTSGNRQSNKKGYIKYLLNEQLSLTPADLLDIFEGHNIARKKLKSELLLFMQGERNVEKYRAVGIN